MNPTRISGLVAFAAVLSIGSVARAQTFDQDQPRRAEVVKRLDNEDARIRAGRTEGELSRRQGNQLRKEDRAIRAEERADAALNHGRVTKGEQRQLNKQENELSRQIHRDR